MSKRTAFTAWMLLVVCTLVSTSAQAANGVPSLMPFQARVTNAAGNPITFPVVVNLRVYPPAGGCYLYEETFNVTPNPFGIFSVVLGAGAVSGPGNTIPQIFNNDVASVADSCATTYVPGPNDWRRLEIVVDGVPLAAMQTIGAAGFAVNSQLLSGKRSEDFVNIGTNITQVNIESLVDGSDVGALHNHDAAYAGLSGNNSFSGNLSTTGNIYSTSVGSAIGIGTGAASADLHVKKDSPTIRLEGNVGQGGSPRIDFYGGATQRGSIQASEGSDGLRLYSGAALGMTLDATANAIFSASVRSAGTVGVGTYSGASETALTTYLAGAGPSAIGTIWSDGAGQLKYWNGAAPVSIANSSSVVNSITAGNGITLGGTATAPSISVAYGSAVNTAIQGNATFAGDVSGAYTALSVDKLKGIDLDFAVAPVPGDVLRYNGAGDWVPSTIATTLGFTPVNRAGDTMTGLLVLSADPSVATGAATKQYVDAVSTASAGAYVRRDGTTTLSANWDVDGAGVGTILITGLASPAASDGAATKGYVDGRLLGNTVAAPGAGQVLQSIRWNAANTAWEYFSPGDALLAGNLSQFAATTSAQLAGVLSNETGTGLAVFATSPNLTTPTITGANLVGFNLNGSTSGGITMQVAATGATGTYTWPSAVPGSNQVLQSDATGALSWIAASGGDALTTNPLSQFAATTSAQLAGVLSNETGTGVAVFDTSPTITTPVIGTSFQVAGATNGGVTFTVPAAGSAGTYTWPGAVPGANRILQTDNTGALSWIAAPIGDALVANPLSQFAATTSAQLAGVLSNETGTGLAVFDTSPTIKGFTLGGATSDGIVMQVAATGAAGTYTWPSAVPGANRILQTDNTGALSWVAASTGDALVANPLSQFAATTSAQLAGVLSNETGTGAAVFGTSPTITTPTLTTPTITTGFTVNGSTSGATTINAAAVTTNGTYTWPAAVPGANRILQSDNTGVLTWVAASTGDALVANPLSQFAATTSAQLAGVLSNETGSGAAVFGTSPTLTTPTITTGFTVNGSTSGATTINAAAVTTNGTYTWPAAVPGANRILQSDNTGVLTWVAASTGDALVANPLSQFAATTSAQLAGVLSNETGTGVAVFGTSPTITTPVIGTSFQVAGSTNGGVSFTVPAAGSAGTYTWPVAVPGANRILQSDNTGALSWVAASTGDALVANPLSQFAATTSAQLAGVLSNETGTGVAVFGTSPTITTPTLTTPTITTGFTVNGSTSGATTINAAAVTTNGTYTWPAAVPAGNRVLQSDNTGVLSWITASTGDALVANPLSQFAATTSAQLAGVLSNETGTGLAVFGTSPTITTPAIGTGFTVNGATNGNFTINAPAAGASGTYVWPSAVPGANRLLQSDNAGNLTWVAAGGGGDAFVANPLSQFAATTSAQLAGVLSNETGTGLAVFDTSPTITTPVVKGFTLGGATSDGIVMQVAATGAAGTYTWPSAVPGANRILQTDNTGALSWVAASTGDALVANPLSQFAATTSAQLAGVLSNETGTGAAVFGTSPTITTPTITTGFTVNGSTSGATTINAAAVTTNGTYTWPAAVPAGNRVLQSDNTGVLSWITASTGDALVANPLSQFAATTSAQLAGVISNETGSGSLVFGTSPTFSTGFAINGSTSGTATINAAAVTTNGTYTWPAAVPAGNRILQSDNTGALTWVTAATGDALVANPLSQFAATTSAQLAGVLSNETGTGVAVFGTSPTITTPTLTTPTITTGFTVNGSTSGATTINAAAVTTNGTYTWPAAVPAGNRVLQSDNTGVLSWITASTGDALVANPLSQFAATTSAQLAGVLSNETGSGAAVFGTSPTLVTPSVTTSLALNGATNGGVTFTVAAAGASGTYTWPSAAPGANRILQSDATGALSWVVDTAGTGDALVANPLSQFAATTSAQLAGVLSNETGTGVAVFGTSPTITTPAIGTGFTVNGATNGNFTINAPAAGASGTYVWPSAVPAGNRLLQSDNAGNLTWIAAGGGGDAFVANPLSQFAATTSAQLAGVLSNETGTGVAVFGTSPTITTPTITGADLIGFNLNGSTSGGITMQVAATGAAGTYTWPSAVPGANRILQSDNTGALSWVAASTGDALVANPLSQFAATTSAQLAGVLSNETGSGAAVFGTSPTLTTPTVGTGITFNGATNGSFVLNAPATGATGTYVWPSAVPGANRILQSDNTGALSWVAASTGDALVANPLSQFAATTSAQLAGVLSNETGTGVAVFGTSPTITTPTLTTPTITTGFTVNGSTSGATTINAAAVTTNGTYTWPAAVPAGNRVLQSDNTGVLSWITASTGDALVANPLSQFAATTSAQLAGVISNETGSGSLVFGTSPTFSTGFAINGSTSGTATINAAAVTTNGTYTWPAAVPAGNRILQSDNTGALTWVTAATGDALVANPLSQFAATTSAQLAGVLSNETGTGVAVFGTSPTITTPAIGTGFTVNGATNGNFTINAPAAGASGTYVWPSAVPAGNRLLQSDNAGNLTWIAAGGGGDAFVANPLSQFAATTSAQLAGVLSNETGTGVAVFGTSPTITTPTLTTPTITTGFTVNGSTSGATTINAAAVTTNGTYTWPAAVPAGNRVLQSDNTGVLSWITASTGDALVANPLSQFAATTSAQLAGVLSNETGSGAAVFGTSPTLVTPSVTTSLALNGATNGGVTFTVAAAGASGTYTWPSAAPGANRILQSDNTGALSWVAASTGDALVANPLSQFAATTSAQLAGVLSNETGTGVAVFGTSPTITTPTLTTPTITTGFTVNGATNGNFTINAPAAGASGTYVWPSAVPAGNRLLQSDNAGNLTWIAAGGGGDAFVANPLSQFAATTSAQLAGVLSNETGTGVAVFGTSPTITTPTIATGFTVNGSTSGATTINAAAVTTNGTYTWPAAVPAGNRVLQSDNTGVLSWITASTGDALVANPLSQFAATTSAQLAGVLSNETGSGAAVFGTSPTLTTPTVGTGITFNGATNGSFVLNAPATGATGTYVWPSAVPGANRILQSDNTGALSWVAASTGDALVANPLSQFAATTSAQLAGVLSNETGTGVAVFGTSPTITTPTLTTPTITTGFTVNGSTSGATTINAAAVTTNGTYTWPAAVPAGNRVLQSDNTGALTWVTAATGDALVANPLSQFAATTSAQLAGVLSNETGSGAAVFGTSPTITTPTVGTGITFNGATNGSFVLNAPATGATGTYVWPSAVPGANRILQSDNTGALSWVAASTGDALVANPLSQFAATTSAQLAGVLSNETGSGAAVFGTSPTLVTPSVTTSLALNGATNGGVTFTVAAAGASGTYTWPSAAPGANRILQSDNTGALSWVAASTGDALVANPLSQFAATTSAQLAGVLSNETGTGVAVFGTSPTITTPTLTTPTITTGFTVNGSTSGATTINAAAVTTNGTYTWPAAVPAGNRVLQSDNTGTLTWVTAATGDALVANPLSQFAATTSAQLAGVLSNETGSGAAVFGTSPTLTTPTITTGFTVNGSTSGATTINAAAVTTNGTYTWPAAVPAGNRVLQSDNTGVLSWITASTGDALVANPLSQFAATTSAQLAGVISNETGTGSLVFGTSPTFSTGFAINGSTSGTATINAAAVTTNGTYTWPAAIPAGNRVLQSDNTGVLSWITASTGDALVANPLSQFAATTSAQLAGVLSNETGTGVAVFGTSPTITTPTLTTPTITTGFTVNGSTSGATTINAAAVTTNGTYTWPAAVPAGNRVLQSDNTGVLSWITASTGDALTTGHLGQFAATTSAQLRGVLSDETGTGAAVFGTSPTITTANLIGFNLNGSTSGGITMQVAATGAAGTYTWPSAVPGANRIMQTDSAGNLSWISTSAELAGVLTNETGTGVVAFATSPTFTTDITTPMIVGGTGTTSTLTYKTTTGVGTTNADHIFLVGNNGGTEAMRILNSGSIGIGTASVTAGVKLEVLGTIRATNLLLTSDRRAKENIQSLNGADALAKIMTIRPVAFDWKEDGSHDSGVIAQELREVFPFMVHDSENGHMSVKYTSLIAPLIASVQELNKKNATLEQENEALKAKLESIERNTASVKDELEEIKELLKSRK